MTAPSSIPWVPDHHDAGCDRTITHAGANSEIHLDPTCGGCRRIMADLFGRHPNGRDGWTRSPHAARPR